MRYIAPLVAMLIFSLVQFADGEIVMTISDDGTDLTMRATGSYDLSEAISPGSTALNYNALINNNSQIYGWATDTPGLLGRSFSISTSGSLTGTSSVLGADYATTNNPFFIWGVSSSVTFRNGAPVVGTVDETAIFNSTTIASLGMVVGERVDVFLQFPQDNIGDNNPAPFATISVVPEPSSLMMFGIAGLVAWRRRR